MIKKFILKKYIIFVTIILFLICFSYFENNNIVISKYNIKSETLPKAFNNFKIVQISDLHNKVFYKNNNSLVAKIEAQKPDIIVITGDLVDRRKYDEENALSFIDKIKSIAPIYYVNGNHEGWAGKFASLEKKLKKSGVFVLRNESVFYEKGKEKILISGVDDPVFNTSGKSEDTMKNELLQVNNKKYFRILLSHRPEMFDLYVQNNIDIAFTGHAHGGQVIIPFIGGVFSPSQGFWPKYYKGMYTKNNTTMVSSRGLGNSIAPQRIFNRPEIVSVILNAENTVTTPSTDSQIIIKEKFIDKTSTFPFGMSKEEVVAKLNKMKVEVINEIEITTSKDDPEWGNKQVWAKGVSFSFDKNNKLYNINVNGD